MHSKRDELAVQVLAAIDVANDAAAVDAGTSAVWRHPRPAAMIDTWADSGRAIRIQVAIAWASVAWSTTMVCPAAFAPNASLEYLWMCGGVCVVARKGKRILLKMCVEVK